jgi:hypothetical protein
MTSLKRPQMESNAVGLEMGKRKAVGVVFNRAGKTPEQNTIRRVSMRIFGKGRPEREPNP